MEASVKYNKQMIDFFLSAPCFLASAYTLRDINNILIFGLLERFWIEWSEIFLIVKKSGIVLKIYNIIYLEDLYNLGIPQF